MPRYLKQNGEKAPNVKTEKAWFHIPIKTTEIINVETYLIPTRVADYIEKLERKIVGELPRLRKKYSCY